MKPPDMCPAQPTPPLPVGKKTTYIRRTVIANSKVPLVALVKC